MSQIETAAIRLRALPAVQMLEFRGADDPALLRALADRLDAFGDKPHVLLGLELTIDYDGDGCEHILYASIETDDDLSSEGEVTPSAD